MRKGIWILFVLPLLCACAGVDSRWYNANVPLENMSRQLEIDSGRCEMVARGATPMPNIPVSSGSRLESGNFTITGGGETYTGSYIGSTSDLNGFGNSLAQGWAMGEAIAASSARDRIFKSCMVSLGWEKVSRDYVSPNTIPRPVISEPSISVRMPFRDHDFSKEPISAYPHVEGGMFLFNISKEGLFLIDINNISISGSIVTVHSHLHALVGEDKGQTLIIKTEIDCGNGLSRDIGDLTVYTGLATERAQNTKRIGSSDGKWTEPVKGSPAYRLIQYCCTLVTDGELQFLKKVAERHDNLLMQVSAYRK